MLTISLNYSSIARVVHIPDLQQRLHSDSRSRKLVDVRRAVAALLFEQGYSITEIARELKRDQKTIRYHLDSHRQLCDVDEVYRSLVAAVQPLLDSSEKEG